MNFIVRPQNSFEKSLEYYAVCQRIVCLHHLTTEFPLNYNTVTKEIQLVIHIDIFNLKYLKI